MNAHQRRTARRFRANSGMFAWMNDPTRRSITVRVAPGSKRKRTWTKWRGQGQVFIGAKP